MGRLLQPLSESQLKRLEQHRYLAAGRSLLEPPLQLYWVWLVGRVPAWLAPNAITVLGLLSNLLSTLLLIYYCPRATEQAPPYAYVLCGLGLFIYQSLDAIDGKQARRTNSSSPLGELFDHGCDSISTVFVGLGSCLAVRLGTDSDVMFFCCFVGMFMFYCAHWQTYVSGSLRFGLVDVTEVQICIILIFFLSAIGGPSLWDYEAPPYAYVLCGLGLFIYQSLDAIDGKQARRTNSSSPLGELFDHGCDSISTVFVGLGSCLAVRLGTDSDVMFFCCFVGMFMFYCAHWQTYVSGSLRFGLVDVTEVQICIILIFFLSAIGGPSLWDYEIPVLGLRMKILPVFGIIGGAIYSCTNYFRIIFSGGTGKNGSTIADTSVLSPALHIGLVIIMAIMIYKKSTTHLFEDHPCLYVLTFGCVASKITNKLVVAHMTKSKVKLQDTAFIGPGLLFLNQYFDSFIDEYFVLWAAMILSLCDLVIYCTTVCIQIASHLNIQVFRIPLPAPEQISNHRD